VSLVTGCSSVTRQEDLRQIAEVNNDITALVQAEEARARLAIVAESSDDG
jgi:hypothetical protein